MHKYVSENILISALASDAVEKGDYSGLSMSMKRAQETFDSTAGKVVFQFTPSD